MAASLMSKSFAGSSLTGRVQQTRRASHVTRVTKDRAVWLPGVVPPAHLKGQLPGDSGFDPLGLGADASRLKWYQEAEKTNGRWAMAAVAGILFTDAMGLPKWYEAGAQEYDIPATAQLGVLFPVMGFLELKRLQGFKETGTSGFINSFPFDPAGMNSPSMQTKEVKNGRLAMVAFVGFAVQALVSRTGPVEGLTKHLADPFGHNITGYLTHLPEVLSGTY